MPKNKTTRPLAGPAFKKYVRELVEADTEIAGEAGRRLTDILAREIAEARVRLPLPVRRKIGPAEPVAPTATIAQQPVVAPPSVQPDTTAPQPAAPAFDPYAFSAVAVFTRAGRDGLLQRLAGINDTAQLRALAEAQHIAVPKDTLEPDALRHAIVEGAERRIAERRAAAS
jgi:hypothetical protein